MIAHVSFYCLFTFSTKKKTTWATQLRVRDFSRGFLSMQLDVASLLKRAACECEIASDKKKKKSFARHFRKNKWSKNNKRS